MGIIEIRGVKKRFGKNLVLDDINLEVEEKDIFGIIGINGSGKSTLLKILVGFYKPTKGKIMFNNKKIKRLPKRLKKEIGFTSQDISFYPKLTVKENMFYFGTLYGLSRKKIIQNMKKVLYLVELDHAKNVLAQNLSGGMKRRLDLACSIIHEPKVLILDEPTADLDPALRRDIVSVIKKINKLGTTIIITSHLLDDIESLCKTIAILHNKKIKRIGTVEQLRKAYNKEEEIHLEIESGNYNRIIRYARVNDYEKDGNKLIVYTNQAERKLHTILHIIENDREKLIYVDIKKPSLVEIFEEITRRTR